MTTAPGTLVIALATLWIGAVSAGTAQPPAPSTPRPELGVQTIASTELVLAISKSGGVVGLLNASLRAKELLDRYASWVDARHGPTGKEHLIQGLYAVGNSAKDAIELGRAAAASAPAIAPLDDATRRLAATFEALIPILNEANDYYERKDYLSDHMAGGKALHARLMPAATAFLAARAAAEALQGQFNDLIDRQELAAIEKKEGKSLRWHGRNTMMLASKAVDLMPTSPKHGADLKAFDAALAAFGDAVRDFDDALRTSGKTTRSIPIRARFSVSCATCARRSPRGTPIRQRCRRTPRTLSATTTR